jgi:DNA-binding CsgD family transcriptional regulator
MSSTHPIHSALSALDGASVWLNSEPLTADGLRGSVGLVDFWTYSCVNWLRTLPYVRAWQERYRDHGLVVVGVHAPEFGFEHDLDNVRRAATELGVGYPVVIDNDFTRLRPELGRAHLLYGEWLRRANRRVDARKQLRTAHEMLGAIGMEAFAERARKELVATGAKVRKRTVETRDDLTEQELQIARLARQGLSNPEIAAQLFLSPRTVEWHLRKVFTKLDIHSRRELAIALPSSDSQLVPA